MTWDSWLQTQQRWRVYHIARAAITRYNRVGGLNSRNTFSHSSGVWKSKLKVLAELVSPEASLRGLWMATLAASSHGHPSGCTPGVSLDVLIPSSCKDTGQVGSGPFFT